MPPKKKKQIDPRPSAKAESFEIGGGTSGGGGYSPVKGGFLQGLVGSYQRMWSGGGGKPTPKKKATPNPTDNPELFAPKPAPRMSDWDWRPGQRANPLPTPKQPPTTVQRREPTIPKTNAPKPTKKMEKKAEKSAEKAEKNYTYTKPSEWGVMGGDPAGPHMAAKDAYFKSLGRQMSQAQATQVPKRGPTTMTPNTSWGQKFKALSNPVGQFFLPAKPPGRSPGNQALRDVAKTYPTIIAAGYLIGKGLQWAEDRYSTGTESKKHIQHKSPREYLVGAFGQEAVTRSEAKGKTRKGKSRYGPGTGK